MRSYVSPSGMIEPREWVYAALTREEMRRGRVGSDMQSDEVPMVTTFVAEAAVVVVVGSAVSAATWEDVSTGVEPPPPLAATASAPFSSEMSASICASVLSSRCFRASIVAEVAARRMMWTRVAKAAHVRPTTAHGRVSGNVARGGVPRTREQAARGLSRFASRSPQYPRLFFHCNSITLT